jgi:hypothetical protein
MHGKHLKSIENKVCNFKWPNNGALIQLLNHCCQLVCKIVEKYLLCRQPKIEPVPTGITQKGVTELFIQLKYSRKPFNCF